MADDGAAVVVEVLVDVVVGPPVVVEVLVDVLVVVVVGTKVEPVA